MAGLEHLAEARPRAEQRGQMRGSEGGLIRMRRMLKGGVSLLAMETLASREMAFRVVSKRRVRLRMGRLRWQAIERKRRAGSSAAALLELE